MFTTNDPSAHPESAVRLAHNVWRIFGSFEGPDRSVIQLYFLLLHSQICSQNGLPTLPSKLLLD